MMLNKLRGDDKEYRQQYNQEQVNRNASVEPINDGITLLIFHFFFTAMVTVLFTLFLGYFIGFYTAD